MLTQEAGSLEAHCNKIANGECRSLACLQRGGYVRGTEPPDSSVATCPELEKAVAKRRAATLLQQQRHLLSLAGKKLDAFIEQQAAPPVVVPVPVAERLPGEGDCDVEGKCWWYGSGLDPMGWHFGVDDGYLDCTHWLPAHAIPLPQAGEVEA
jgi:hypothetical protein